MSILAVEVEEHKGENDDGGEEEVETHVASVPTHAHLSTPDFLNPPKSLGGSRPEALPLSDLLDRLVGESVHVPDALREK